MMQGKLMQSILYQPQLSALRKKATLHQVTTVLATSKNVPFPGHNHLLTIGTDDLICWLLHERQWYIYLRLYFSTGA